MRRQWCIGQYHPSGVVPLLLPSALLCPVTSHNLLRLSEDNDTKDKDKQDNNSEDNINDKDKKDNNSEDNNKDTNYNNIKRNDNKADWTMSSIWCCRVSALLCPVTPFVTTPDPTVAFFFFIRNFLSVVLIVLTYHL